RVRQGQRQVHHGRACAHHPREGSPRPTVAHHDQVSALRGPSRATRTAGRECSENTLETIVNTPPVFGPVDIHATGMTSYVQPPSVQAASPQPSPRSVLSLGHLFP